MSLTRHIHFRLSNDDFERLKDRIKQSKFQFESEYLRQSVLRTPDIMESFFRLEKQHKEIVMLLQKVLEQIEND